MEKHSKSIELKRDSDLFPTASYIGDENGYRNGDPDLSLYRILGCALKCFDPLVLFDPFEKLIHLSTKLVLSSDNVLRQRLEKLVEA